MEFKRFIYEHREQSNKVRLRDASPFCDGCYVDYMQQKREPIMEHWYWAIFWYYQSQNELLTLYEQCRCMRMGRDRWRQFQSMFVWTLPTVPPLPTA